MKFKHLFVGAVFSVVSAAGGVANAATYLFTYLDTAGNTANGTIVTSGFGSVQTITSITGLFDSFQITALSPYAASDQQLFTATTPNFDFGGVSFSVANGIDYNLFAGGDPLGDTLDSISDPGGGANQLDPILDFSLTQVPEPATWGLMLLGVSLMGAGLRASRGRRALT